MTDDVDIEAEIRRWREFVASRRELAPADVDELESHLRDRIDEFRERGLAPDEAFLIAVKRMGRVDELSREFAREHSDRLWKQLVTTDAAVEPRRGWLVALGFGVAAGIAVKLPQLFSRPPAPGSVTVGGDSALDGANAAILVLAVLAAYFAFRTRPPVLTTAVVAVGFACAAILLNVYPFAPDGMTLPLAALHAPIALWLAAGVLYAGGDWRTSRARMDFVRFTGEWLVYFVLIALGGAVLVFLTINLFSAIGLDAEPFVVDWVLPCGASGAVVIAAWLVDAKQAVIENIAPVLTRIFTPLFTALLLALIVAAAARGGDFIESDRDLLILFDIALIVVVGLLLYTLSARDPLSPAGWFEWLQVVMIGAALVVDVLVLVAMLGRIGEFGASPNKMASLGLNLILLANLVGAAVLHVRFARRLVPFASVERWQTSFVPVYLAWTAAVVAIFPPTFGFA